MVNRTDYDYTEEMSFDNSALEDSNQRSKMSFGNSSSNVFNRTTSIKTTK